MPESVKHFIDSLWTKPVDFWVIVFFAIIVLHVLGVVFKKIIQISHVVFVIALLVVAGVICVKWVREGGEPAFMTPVVNFVSSFFHTSAAAPR